MPPACSHCGAALIGSGKFCASCGTPAPNLASTLPSAPRAPFPSKPPAASQPRQVSAPPPARASGYASAPAVPSHPPPPSYTIGARVLVQWADGNRYPGMVQQVAPGQCLIVFPDGQQRWVENRYLSLHP